MNTQQFHTAGARNSGVYRFDTLVSTSRAFTILKMGECRRDNLDRGRLRDSQSYADPEQSSRGAIPGSACVERAKVSVALLTSRPLKGRAFPFERVRLTGMPIS